MNMMQSNRWRIDKLYSFNLYPRNVGNPNQIPVFNYLHYLSFIEANNGKNPIFISHNPYYNDNMLYTQMVWDVDTDKQGTTIYDAHEDVKKLVNYFRQYDTLVSLSSHNGFHFYLRFQPTTLPLNENLTVNVKNFQRSIVEKLGLHTVNLSCAEPKRIIRVPGTQYVTRENGVWKIGKEWCIPINQDDINDLTTDEIISMAYMHDTSSLPYIYGKTHDIKDLQKEVSFSEIISTQNDSEDIDIDFMHISYIDFLKWCSMIFDPALLAQVTTHHPHHTANYLSALEVMNYDIDGQHKFSEFSLLTFFARLSLVYKWDNRNLDIQRQQLHQIYSRRYALQTNNV